MLFSRWFYYFASVPTLLKGIANWPIAIRMFLGLPVRKPVVIELKNGCRFKVRTGMDVWIIKETCLDRDYERNSVPIKDGWVVIDIGAGLGDFAITVAREHPGSVVYAYEPFPESFTLLQENIELNRVSNVRAFPYAVGKRSETMCLETTTGIAVQHSTARTATSLNPGAVQVPGLSLADIFLNERLSRCDFLKVDCEGAEYDIFLHTDEETLRKIRHVCLEYHDGVTAFSHADLIQFFKENGFQVKIHPSPAHSDLGFLYASR